MDQWQRSAEILIVDVNHVRVGDLSRWKERTLRSLDAGAGFLVPVRQVVQPVQLVKVSELFHPRVTGVHGGILGQGTVSLVLRQRALRQQKTKSKTEKQKIGGIVSLFLVRGLTVEVEMVWILDDRKIVEEFEIIKQNT